jgi:aminopeptidase N
MTEVRFTEARDYRRPDFLVDTVDLDFNLSVERTVVRNTMHLRRQKSAAPLVLNGVGLELLHIELNGTVLPKSSYQISLTSLQIDDCPDEFNLTVVTACAPNTNTSSRGLFLVGNTLTTQCEAEGFRKITYFPDRPDILARYVVRLEADKAQYPLLLSNGNLTDSGEIEGGRHWVRWEDPYPKPCYIFAIIAGNLDCLDDHFITRSGKNVSLKFYSDTGFPERCRSAMNALKRSLSWDEEAFDLEYDLDTYNVVALTGYGGAMENKGLNLFDTSGVLADADIATDEEALTIARIIAHEQFHNWTGNRVTCRDWFQLCLKEGLTRYRDQRFTEDITGGRFRIDEIRALMRNQFPEDDGPAAHPVQPERYSTIENFYTNTVYDKGAELVRMLETLLGRENFRQGFARYIKDNDGKAATIDDFLSAMEGVSGKDLAQFRLWYSQAGRPRLSVKTSYETAGKKLRLDLEQKGRLSALPVHIPLRIGLMDVSGDVLTFRSGNAEATVETVLELKSERQTIILEDVERPPIVSILRGFSAPVSVDFPMSAEERVALLLHDIDPYVRWESAQSLFVEEIRRLAACVRNGQPANVSDVIVEGLSPLFSWTGDPWLLSELLLLPDEPRLSDGLSMIPLESHMQARFILQQTLARRYETEWRRKLSADFKPDETFPDMLSVGERKLTLLALEYLMSLGLDSDAQTSTQWATRSSNMTLSQGALAILVNYDVPQRQKALDGFFERWRDYPTVINKWFMVQALSRMPGAIDHIISLEAHPAFDRFNVARAMAYYGSFCRQNRVAFHDPSGKGYEFLASRLIDSDRMGRASGRWLIAQITQWRRYDAERQTLMRRALQRVLATDDISNGLRDLVTQTLGDGEKS